MVKTRTFKEADLFYPSALAQLVLERPIDLTEDLQSNIIFNDTNMEQAVNWAAHGILCVFSCL
jgi:hypothetical protein